MPITLTHSYTRSDYDVPYKTCIELSIKAFIKVSRSKVFKEYMSRSKGQSRSLQDFMALRIKMSCLIRL